MRPDLNNEKYLAKLRDAVASDEGQVIIEYLKLQAAKFDYEEIDVKQKNELVGEDFKVFHKVNQFINGILSVFDNLLKDN